MSKKKNITVGTIKGIDIVKQTKPIQDIPFRTGVYRDKRKKREKVTKRNMDRWMQARTYVARSCPGAQNEHTFVLNVRLDS